MKIETRLLYYKSYSQVVWLSLYSCGISDLRFVSSLASLQVAQLSFNKIKDIRPLEPLLRIREIYLNANAI